MNFNLYTIVSSIIDTKTVIAIHPFIGINDLFIIRSDDPSTISVPTTVYIDKPGDSASKYK